MIENSIINPRVLIEHPKDRSPPSRKATEGKSGQL